MNGEGTHDYSTMYEYNIYIGKFPYGPPLTLKNTIPYFKSYFIR